MTFAKKLMLKSGLFAIFLFCTSAIYSQGSWKRVHGDGISNPPTINSFALNNSPFSRYAVGSMTDDSGMFWLFGGADFDDLWKFDPNINQWKHVKGDYTGFSATQIFGVLGVEDAANNPGGTSFGHAAWGDLNGNIWVWGLNSESDLWRFNTATEMWTWMKASGPVVYGVQGVADIANNPFGMDEIDCHWRDSNGDLWLYTTFEGNLWKYEVAVNMWTWVNGGAAVDPDPIYGTLDTYAVNNRPGAFAACPSVGTLYTMWITSDDHLWMLVNRFTADLEVEVWEFDPLLGQWRCRRTDASTFGGEQQYPTPCLQNDDASFPVPRSEMRVQWVDECDNMYLFGGGGFCNLEEVKNDIWRYNRIANNYTYLRDGNSPSVLGVQGVFDALNTPVGAAGGQAWQNSNGFYMMGGQGGTEPIDDVWLYQADTVIANFTFATDCPDVNFTDLSTTGCNTIKSWEWDFGDGANSTMQNPVHSYGSSGDYTVSLIVNNCTWDVDTITQIITIDCGFSISLDDSVICLGDCLDLIATSGDNTDLLTFVWDNGILSDNDTINICPLSTTTYTVSTTNNLGEIATATATITVIPIPTVNLGNDMSLCGGTIALDAENAGATFEWQDGSTNQTFLVTETGLYYVEVNNNGCSAIDSIFVSIDGPIVDLGPDISTCNPSINLDVQGAGVNYLWQDGSTDGSFLVSNFGTYWVQVEDGFGCSTSDTIVINMETIAINLGDDVVACMGTSVILDAGVSGADLEWNTGENQQLLTVTSSGQYIATITDAMCIASDVVEVEFYLPIADFSSDVASGCPPLEVVFSDLSSSPYGISEWNWSFGNGATNSLSNPTNLYTFTGTFSASLTITDNNNCTNSVENLLFIEVFPVPQASFSFTPENPTTEESFVSFFDETPGAVSWFWQFGDGAISTQQNPTHIYESAGSYTVTLDVSNAEGCVSSTSWTIFIKQTLVIYVPNSFTPDGDGLNDLFFPVITGLVPSDYSFEIYDRWGHLVFQTTNYQEKWDGGNYGYVNPKDAENSYFVKNGIYNWVMEVRRFGSPDKEKIIGHVTVIR